MTEKKEPYFVEIDEEGCKECEKGRTWTVVGPDGVALATSWTNQEDADYMAEMMNMAYSAGPRNLVEKGKIN